MPKDYSSEPFTKQRLSEYARDDEWIRAFLRKAKFAHVATVFDGQPFINPTTFWYDAERHEIYFHSNVVGRMRANAEGNARVCFEVFESGNLLPSNVALELSVQYASVVAFGTIRVLQDDTAKERALYGLMQKYFSHLTVGELIRPITEKELKRTSVYAIAIESWSGKENWVEMAEQSDEWAALPVELLNTNHRE
jgi:uncharacterized protein